MALLKHSYTASQRPDKFHLGKLLRWSLNYQLKNKALLSNWESAYFIRTVFQYLATTSLSKFQAQQIYFVLAMGIIINTNTEIKQLLDRFDSRRINGGSGLYLKWTRSRVIIFAKREFCSQNLTLNAGSGFSVISSNTFVITDLWFSSLRGR